MSPCASESVPMLLKTSNCRGGVIRFRIPFGENSVIFRYDMPVGERGRPLAIRGWGILHILPLKNFRHVLFTYSLPADQVSDPACIVEMDLLDREMAAAELSRRVGRWM